MKKVTLVILATLIAGVAFAEPAVIRGPHATVETDGSQADGSVNLLTQNAGPINFITNNVKRMSVPANAAGGSFSAGAIRITCFVEEYAAPTS